ncbi:MAG: HAMP domain-containing protein [Acidobacteria bacterium]|nr:HAMP domain-containing protein [Acidobacteriota bacterium]
MGKKGSIYFSFILRVFNLMAVGVALTTALLYYLNLRAETAIKQEVTEHVDGLAEAMNVALQSMPSRIYLHDFLRQNPIRPDLAGLIHHILVTDSRGVIIDSTHPEEVGRRLTGEDSTGAPAGEISLEEIRRNTEPFNPTEVKLHSFPIVTSLETPDGVRRERVFVHVLLFWRGIPSVLRQTSRDRLIAMGAVLSASVLLMVFVVWRFTKPVNDLLQAQKRVARGELDFQLEVRRRDEMGTLVQTFNEMVATLRRNHELEEKLRESERSAAIGRLASGIAHEIRNPLNFINLSIDYVQSNFAPAEPGRQERFRDILASMKAEIARLNRLVTDFLSFGRPGDLAITTTRVGELVKEVCATIQAQATERGINIDIKGADAVPPIQADADRLRICLSNLMINALQAITGHGHLEIGLAREGEFLRIAVSDDGPGIPEADLERVFEPYYSTKETGIGLGLAVTRKIVQDHGGRIRAANVDGHGICFTIMLPISPPQTPPARTAPADYQGSISSGRLA